MGQRHQTIIVAKFGAGGDYRVVTILHSQWLYGTLAVQRCCSVLTLLSKQQNVPKVRDELEFARKNEETFVKSEAFALLPFIATCLMVSDLTPKTGDLDRSLELKPIGSDLEKLDNDDGFTILDISKPERLRYGFLHLEKRSYVAKTCASIELCSAEAYAAKYSHTLDPDTINTLRKWNLIKNIAIVELLKNRPKCRVSKVPIANSQLQAPNGCYYRAFDRSANPSSTVSRNTENEDTPISQIIYVSRATGSSLRLTPKTVIPLADSQLTTNRFLDGLWMFIEYLSHTSRCRLSCYVAMAAAKCFALADGQLDSSHPPLCTGPLPPYLYSTSREMFKSSHHPPPQLCNLSNNCWTLILEAKSDIFCENDCSIRYAFVRRVSSVHQITDIYGFTEEKKLITYWKGREREQLLSRLSNEEVEAILSVKRKKRNGHLNDLETGPPLKWARGGSVKQ